MRVILIHGADRVKSKSSNGSDAARGCAARCAPHGLEPIGLENAVRDFLAHHAAAAAAEAAPGVRVLPRLDCRSVIANRRGMPSCPEQPDLGVAAPAVRYERRRRRDHRSRWAWWGNVHR